jgi:hypothetical protein
MNIWLWVAAIPVVILAIVILALVYMRLMDWWIARKIKDCPVCKTLLGNGLGSVWAEHFKEWHR